MMQNWILDNLNITTGVNSDNKDEEDDEDDKNYK